VIDEPGTLEREPERDRTAEGAAHHVAGRTDVLFDVVADPLREALP